MKYKFYNYFLILLLILGGGSIFKQSRFLSLSLLLSTFIYILFLLLYKNKTPLIKNTFHKYMNVFVIISIVFLLQMMFLPNNLFSNQYFYYEFQVITIMLILYYIEVNKLNFSYYLYKVLIIFMYQGVISFLVWFIFKDMAFRLDVSKDNAVDSIFYLFYYQNTIMSHISAEWKLVNLFGFSFMRNQGLFWEPGVYQIYLNILLYLSLFYYKNRKIVLLTIFAIITTWSTTGFIILVMQMIIYITLNIKKARFLFLLPLLIIAFSFFINITIDNINEKFYGAKQGSSIQREIDTLSSINIIEKNPLFGIGLDSKNYFNLLEKNAIFISGGRGSVGVSNSVLYLALDFGIPLGLLLLLALYKQSLLENKKLVLFLIILISSLTEPVLVLMFFVLFIVSGLLNLFKKSYNINDSWEKD